MWKESYKIGVDQIDLQHLELFRRVEAFMQSIREGADVSEVQKTVAFLKDYVVYHFQAEESYQDFIGYAFREEHKQMHQKFASVIQKYEARLKETNYDPVVVKKLAGTLLSWLIDHVTDADLNIVKGENGIRTDRKQPVADVIYSCFFDTFYNLTGLRPQPQQAEPAEEKDPQTASPGGDVVVSVDFYGDVFGSFTFACSEQFALQLMHNMLMTKLHEIDDLVCSALIEIVDITFQKAVIYLSNMGMKCEIMPPVIELTPKGHVTRGTLVDTEFGCFELCIDIDQL